jgi:glycosyltransferase involved in cell wall biosynthesis
MSTPRVAFFPDCYLETNGVARTARAVEAYARRHEFPFLCVHAGSTTRMVDVGQDEGGRLELRRSPIGFAVEHDLTYDLMFSRHYRLAVNAVRRFRPDVLHVTGPHDVGQLGAYIGHYLHIPIVGSWHTNVHEFASRRALKHLSWLPVSRQVAFRGWVERLVLSATLQFYRIPRVVLAPNEEIVDLLHRRTRRPAHLMMRGVDTDLFAPTHRAREDDVVQIGFVGRLSPEKSVRRLAAVAQALVADGRPFRFVIVGEGSERGWLEKNVAQAQFRGVLVGEALSRAYADMDLFVFPSETETFGNVLLEAMASGVPVVAMAHGGPRFIVADGVSGVMARDERDLVEATVSLVHDAARRARMARAARLQAEATSWEKIGGRLYEVYEEAAAMRRPALPDAGGAALAGGAGVEPRSL